MENGAFADIIFFACLAGYIWFKLRQALGNRDHNHPTRINKDLPPFGKDGFSSEMKKQQGQPSRVVELDPQDVVVEDMPERRKPVLKEVEITNPVLADTIKKIKAADRNFSVAAFLEGAKMAFDMVVEAFAKGDKSTLENLLHKDIYKSFSDAIDARAGQDEHEETTLVAIKSADVTVAELKGSKATLGVKFISEEINVVKNREGQIVKGDPSRVEKVEDVWVFERNIYSSNPNWTITAT